MQPNRIVSNLPQSLFEVLLVVKKQQPKRYSLIRTALVRYTAPIWGGPPAPPREQVPPDAIEFLKTLPLITLFTALQDQAEYFEQIGADPACRRRNRHYLKQLLDIVQQQGWLPGLPTPRAQLGFNRLRKPVGEKRTYAHEIRTTTRRRLPPFALGAQNYPEDYVLVDGVRVLGNAVLHQQLEDLKQFVLQDCSLSRAEQIVHSIKLVLGYLHRQQHVPLAELFLTTLIPFVQLRFSEQDFQDDPDFALDPRGQLANLIAAYQKLAMAEAVALRTAKQRASLTTGHVNAYFEWRQQVLSRHGQPDGLTPAAKRQVLGAVLAASKFLYRRQTDRHEAKDYEDVPVVRQLKIMAQQQKVDPRQVKKQIEKRCVTWEQAMEVLRQQLLQATELCSRVEDPRNPAWVRTYKRTATAIAIDMQKALALALMMLIPTDRQQTYRRLQFGTTLKNGQFATDGSHTFLDWGPPAHPDEASLWINLDDFKTVETYGEFWYPVPNVQFSTGRTLYQYIAAWVWGFEDQSGQWSSYYKGENRHWQGYIDAAGVRGGWRAALQPEHGYLFTMPITRQPHTSTSFRCLIREIFVHFTQEEGVPVAVTPHSLRHMLSTYLNRLGISEAEKESFSYVLHHSPEIHQGHYVHQDNLHQIGPAVKRMEQIIRTFV